MKADSEAAMCKKCGIGHMEVVKCELDARDETKLVFYYKCNIKRCKAGEKNTFDRSNLPEKEKRYLERKR